MAGASGIAAAQARITVTELFDKWEKAELVDRKDKGAEVRRMFAKDVFPLIGNMAAYSDPISPPVMMETVHL